MIAVPLLIEFAPQTSLYRERDLVSHLPILRNGPAGTFVLFPDGLKVSLPTDQIVFAEDRDGAARVGFGGMSFAGTEHGRLIFLRVRDLQPEEQLSPARSHVMTLETRMVSSILVDGRPVWSGGPAINAAIPGLTKNGRPSDAIAIAQDRQGANDDQSQGSRSTEP